MKKRIVKFVSVVLICLLLFSLVVVKGCIDWRKAYGAYFATWEELDAYIRENAYSKSVSYYLSPAHYVDMPDDDRFVESAYIIYNTNYMNGNGKKKILNIFSHTAFRLEIDGEDVYIFGLEFTLSESFEPTLIEFDSVEQMFEMCGDTPLCLSRDYAVFDADFKPKGFMKEFMNQSREESRRIYEKSICFGYGCEDSNGIMRSYRTWAIYDTRDVPQSEKDALALELMEILYNNYKLAGQKAE